MFDRDKWQEIFGTIRKNKLRTFLTALSVAWGIFILIVLLGCSTAFRNSAQDSFINDAVNTLEVDPGMTSIPYKGFKIGRKIQFVNEDYELIRKKLSENLQYTSAQYNGTGEMRNLSYKNQHNTFCARSCMPEHNLLENAPVTEGRFINDIDIKEFRKVCCVSPLIQKTLFINENPLNKFIDVDGIPFKVVGTFKDAADRDNDRIYIPLSTAQRVFNGKGRVDVILSNVSKDATTSTQEIINQIRLLLAQKYNVDPSDINAIRIGNWSGDYETIMSLFRAIEIFTWVIGIFTLFAGVVGVSNIMMIVVKERTKEIGIRKAIGATPFSIVMLIVQESVFITAAAGYFGLFTGLGAIQLLNTFKIEGEFFHRPDVDLSVAISATILIIVCGALAGLFPALRAAKVEPIEALRTE